MKLSYIDIPHHLGTVEFCVGENYISLRVDEIMNFRVIYTCFIGSRVWNLFGSLARCFYNLLWVKRVSNLLLIQWEQLMFSEERIVTI